MWITTRVRGLTVALFGILLLALPVAASGSPAGSVGPASNATGLRPVKIAADLSDAGAFGIAVDVTPDGGTAIVGAQQHNFNRGGAYLFQRVGSQWAKTADLTIDGLQFGDSYGNAVAISADGTWAMVGQVGWQQLTGRVLVFHKTADGWQSAGKLVGPDPTMYTHFGDSISMDAAGDTAVIGELGADGFVGRAYVFSRGADDVWAMSQELAAPEPAAVGQLDFGTSVSLSADGSTALIGANAYKAAAGAAYVFRDEGGRWSQVGKLLADLPQSGAYFGTSVALDATGATALVGAVYENGAVGAAYVFRPAGGAAGTGGTGGAGGTWTQVARLAVADANQFGNAVAINQGGTEAVVGAEASQTTGTAYVYTVTPIGWVHTETLWPPVSDRALFGVAVSLDAVGDEAVIGAAFDDDNQPTQSGFGAVYIAPGLPNGPIGANW